MTRLLPGEFCDVHIHVIRPMDHRLATVSACEVATVPQKIIAQICDEHPAILRACRVRTTFESTLREQIANVGGRGSACRLGHLICEIHHPLKAIDMAPGACFDLPISQTNLADAIGVTPIHANRSLQALGRAKLLTFDRHRLTILDFDGLDAFSDFTADYLHLPRQDEGRRSSVAVGL